MRATARESKLALYLIAVLCRGRWTGDEAALNEAAVDIGGAFAQQQQAPIVARRAVDKAAFVSAP
jgi:hypothetical protein